MARSIKNCMFGAIMAVLLSGLAVVTPAYAESPWWHLSSASRPTYLQPGRAKTEVQQLTVHATEGVYELERVGIHGEELGRTRLGVGEEPEQVQLVLEELYGAGNVHVTGGPGAGTNEFEVYEIEFVGELSDQPIDFPNVAESNLKLSLEGREAQGIVSFAEISKGVPDGQLLITAVNLGDADANPATQPITITDSLPPGLKAVKIEAYADEAVTQQLEHPLVCSMGSLSCTFTGKNSGGAVSVPPYYQIQMRVLVDLGPGAKSGEVNEASVVGGGAPGATAKQSLTVSGSPAPFVVNT